MVVGTDQQEEGKDRDWWKGGEWKSWRELKKEGYSYRGAPQEDMGILFLSLASCPHSLHVSLGEEPIHDVVLGQSEQILPSVFHFPLYLSSLFLFAIERGSHFPRNSSFINQTSAACRGRGGGGGWMWRRRSDASDRQQMPRSVSYFLSSETSHRSETAERSLCAWVCVKWRARKRTFLRQMTWLHHTTSSLSFIKPRCFSLSLFSISWMQLTGEADILGGVIPGVESLRSPCCDPVILGRGRVLEACRERKRLSIKNTFCPKVVSVQLYSYK